MKNTTFILGTILSITFLVLVGILAIATELPVKEPELPEHEAGIRNLIKIEQIRNVIGPSDDGKGLSIDLEDETLNGTVYTGPYPFEAWESDYDYIRYRKSSSINAGKGTLIIKDFFQDKYNANSWPSYSMNIAYRLDLWRTKDDGTVNHLGFYDSIVGFNQTDDGFEKNLTIVEGPFIGLVRSDSPSSVLIAWETDEECTGLVYVSNPISSKKTVSFKPSFYSSDMGLKHEVQVEDLQPDTEYLYFILCHGGTENKWTVSPTYSFRTAPIPGDDEVTFAFISDSREGVGGGERRYMGSNLYILNQLVIDSYRKDADFFLFGGDLVNGYTSETEDFRLQLKGWKEALTGFWRSRPVYPAMGNHETLLKSFKGGSSGWLFLDKWPYETDSAEAVFAQEFFNPTNGPDTSDSRRPTYKENVYKFQYGPVLAIAFNNNYWWTTNKEVKNYGGSPEGYIMTDQLEWIEQILADAESDPNVRYIVLYAQEPIFPCGGHVDDAMWWNGNNNLRAYTYTDGELVSAEQGMIEVRNRFWKAIANSSKVAAVLAGDEHEYHRLLVDSNTPVGVMETDDTDGDGVLDQYSPNPDFTNPTWQLTAGTAGAPYYSREDTPWEPEVLSSQHGYILFRANSQRISMTYYTITGQVIDYIDNLMEVKH